MKKLPNGKKSFRRRQNIMYLWLCVVVSLLTWLAYWQAGIRLIRVIAIVFAIPPLIAGLIQLIRRALPCVLAPIAGGQEGAGSTRLGDSISPYSIQSSLNWDSRPRRRQDELVIGVNVDGGARVSWTRKQREDPTLVLGGTRQGKSIHQISLVGQDIRRGDLVILVDPHRDLALNLLPTCLEAARDVIWFEAGDPNYAVGFNPLEVGPGQSPQDVAKVFLDGVRKIWFPGEPLLPSRISDAIYHAAWGLANAGYTPLEIPRVLRSANFRNYLAREMDDYRFTNWVTRFNDELTKHERYEQVQSSLIRIHQLTHDPDMAVILGQRHSSFSIEEALKTKVLLAALPYGQLKEGAYLLGGLLVAKLVDAFLSRITMPFPERNRVYVTIDEFQEIVPDSARQLITSCGKVGCSPTLITQCRGLLESDLRKAVTANCRNIIVFGLQGPEASQIAREIFKPDPLLVKEYHPGGRNVYYTPQEQWAHFEAQIRSLKRFQFLAVHTGDRSQVQCLRVPPFRPPDLETLEAMRQEVLSCYARPRAEVEKEIRERTAKLDAQFGSLHNELGLPSESEPGPWPHAPY